jgi:hypothetical protein
MIIEAFVTGRIGLRPLWAIPKKAKSRQRLLNCVVACAEPALDADRISG